MKSRSNRVNLRPTHEFTGCERGTFKGIEWEWLYWYDRDGKRFLTPEERAERLANQLRELGIDPDMMYYIQPM